MKSHPKVIHPDQLIKDEKKCKHWLITLIDNFFEVIGEKVMPHMIHRIIAFTLPLIVALLVIYFYYINVVSATVTVLVLLLNLFAQSWIQWVGLPLIQHLQVKGDAKRDAKADVDHAALTHIANRVDEILDKIGK